MKKNILLCSIILCASLAGCANQSQKLPETTATSESTKSTENTEKIESATQSEVTAIDKLRKRIADNGCMLGVGFVGYIDLESDEEAVHKSVIESTLANEYPFMKELREVVIDGSELYALVPASKDAVITVYYVEMSEDGNYIDNKDYHLFIGEAGEAIILRCNPSEIFPNILISVKDGEKKFEYRPSLSMKDGHVAVEDGCYDFTNYNITKEKRIQNARDFLSSTDEVSNALERGMKLLYTGDEETVNGQQCLLLALGTEHEDQFVREQLYAVSDEQIFVYSVLRDRWEAL